MLAYLSKGITIGHLLIRRLLRTVVGFPGLLLDCIVAFFWIPRYSSYWREATLPFADGTRVSFARGVLGWIGEALGFIIGPLVGFTIGLAVFAIDLPLRLLRALQKKIYSGLNLFAELIGTIPVFNVAVTNPSSYLEKSWNIGCGIFGILGLPLYIVGRVAESIPFLGFIFSNLLSFARLVIIFLGAIFTSIVASSIYLFALLLDKTGELYEQGANYTRQALAKLYVKLGERPGFQNNCIAIHLLHSEEFLSEFEQTYRKTSFKLLSEKLKKQSEQEESSDEVDEDLLDPITKERLGKGGVPIVVDECFPSGHKYNDYRSTSTRGIHFWLSINKSCPISRMPLSANALKIQH